MSVDARLREFERPTKVTELTGVVVVEKEEARLPVKIIKKPTGNKTQNHSIVAADISVDKQIRINNRNAMINTCVETSIAVMPSQKTIYAKLLPVSVSTVTATAMFPAAHAAAVVIVEKTAAFAIVGLGVAAAAVVCACGAVAAFSIFKGLSSCDKEGERSSMHQPGASNNNCECGPIINNYSGGNVYCQDNRRRNGQ